MNLYQQLHTDCSRPSLSFDRYTQRQELVRRFAWAVPSDEVIAALAARHRAIVELGAGTGYWAHLLKQQGAQVMAFDKNRPSEKSNSYGHVEEWTTVYQGDTSVLQKFARRWTLMLCWPPYDSSMGVDALRAFKGDRVIYIGEGQYGCTGSDAMHELLAAEWKATHVHDIPRWYGMNDYVTEYVRLSTLKETK